MGLTFEWNPVKALTNRHRHGVSFDEATGVFGDPLSLTISDPGHSDREERLLILGRSLQGRLLVVAHVERAGRLRIISARHATQRERKTYEEGQER